MSFFLHPKHYCIPRWFQGGVMCFSMPECALGNGNEKAERNAQLETSRMSHQIWYTLAPGWGWHKHWICVWMTHIHEYGWSKGRCCGMTKCGVISSSDGDSEWSEASGVIRYRWWVIWRRKQVSPLESVQTRPGIMMQLVSSQFLHHERKGGGSVTTSETLLWCKLSDWFFCSHFHPTFEAPAVHPHLNHSRNSCTLGSDASRSGKAVKCLSLPQ